MNGTAVALNILKASLLLYALMFHLADRRSQHFMLVNLLAHHGACLRAVQLSKSLKTDSEITTQCAVCMQAPETGKSSSQVVASIEQGAVAKWRKRFHKC
jgi:hypothetical protein